MFVFVLCCKPRLEVYVSMWGGRPVRLGLSWICRRSLWETRVQFFYLQLDGEGVMCLGPSPHTIDDVEIRSLYPVSADFPAGLAR